MESGFRRLWSRKKSLGAADQSSHQRKLSSSNGVHDKVPVVRDGRPSMASSFQQYERPFSREQSNGAKDLNLTTSNDEFGRSKSNHRIQPMLVGISRPDTGIGKERPDTAGSLQTAVQRAADSVGHRPSDVSASQPISINTTQKSKPISRHIDIFSVAASVPSNLSRYNEEIAERNLDTFRLALENTPYVYDPSSKYQEEVAIRNAYLPYKPRTSSDALRRSTDVDRSASAASRSVRSVVSPQPNGVTSYQPNRDPVTPNRGAVHDQSFHHHRQLSQRSRDGTQLPSIPQEYGDEENLERNDTFKNSMHSAYSPPRSVPLANSFRDNKMHTISEGPIYGGKNVTSEKSTTPRNSDGSSNIAFPEYKVSSTEYGKRYWANTDRNFESSNNLEATFNVHPNNSTASSIRRAIVLPNRTIMDLTNDDSEFFSETSSALWSNYSPVIEQAKSDAFQRVEPSEIHTEERRGSKGPAQLIDITAASPTPKRRSVVVDAPAAISAPEALVSTPPVLGGNAKQEENKPISTLMQEANEFAPSSSFSPISTVASWSPRSSAYITKTTEPLSMTARVAAALEASRAIARENPLPATSHMTVESPTVRERVASYENSRDRSTSPRNVAAESSTNGGQTKIPITSQNVPASQAVKVDSVDTPASKTRATKAPDIPSIHMSPESITSVDYIDPSNAFGVRTRDFALSPRKSPTSVKKETAPTTTVQPQQISTAAPRNQPQKKRAASAGGKKTPAKTKGKDNGFDEAAFARKQAEARAALERLQRSLSEDFMTLPDRVTVQSSGGKTTESETRQSAPILVLPPDSKVTAPVLKRAETEKAPPSSFRTATNQGATASMNSRSLSAGNRSARRAAAPSSLKNVEPATNPIDQNMLSPALLQALQLSSNPPKSPGEISLSSFPVPSSSRPNSQPDAPTGYHSHSNSFVGMMKRRNSTKSQGSTASAFSIPLHMVPGRTSSVRDPVPEEVDPAWG